MTPLRPLLPAVRPQRNLPPEEPPKKRNTVLACESCRRYKTKCDGQPKCRACVKRATTCSYIEPESRQIRKKYERLQRRESTYEDLIEILRTMTEQDAAEVFRLLKAGMDVEFIVKHMRDGNLLMQMSLIPETTRQYEFPYMAKMPSHLFVTNNPYMDSCLYKAVVSSSTHSHAENMQLITKHGRAYLLPYHTAKMGEPLIDNITTTPWTSVISDNRLLRRLVSLYFTCPHPCAPLVHKDLFLEDMAAGRTAFCSPLLVNAVLSVASQMCLEISDRVKVWHPGSLTYKFLAEARRLWDLEMIGKPRITVIQAALVLSLTYVFNSLDGLSTFFLEQAITMGERMHLFEANNCEQDPKMAKARLFTAWKTFSWQMMFDYSYFRPPHMKDPPQIPLPDVELEPQWYGEIWVQYPHDQNLTPLHLGHHMKAEAGLYTAINELGYLCFGRSSRSLTTNEILTLKRKFDAWKEALPKTLQPGELVIPLHFSLHIQYHQTMIALMQLLLENSSDTVIDCGLDVGETPQAIIRASEVMLESLMRLYYMRHSFVHYDPWLIPAMTRLGNNANRLLEGNPNDDPGNLDGYRSTIILCAKAFESQAQNIHVATSLGIQLQSVVKPQMLQLIRTYVKAMNIDKTEEETIAKHPHSQWPLPIINLSDDPEKTKLDHLIEAFEETGIQPGGVKD